MGPLSSSFSVKPKRNKIRFHKSSSSCKPFKSLAETSRSVKISSKGRKEHTPTNKTDEGKARRSKFPLPRILGFLASVGSLMVLE